MTDFVQAYENSDAEGRIAKAVAAERAACAAIARSFATNLDPKYQSDVDWAATEIAKAIEARGRSETTGMSGHVVIPREYRSQDDA